MKTVFLSFTPGGRRFSYLCSDATIAVGDAVSIVANGGGEKVLEVLEVRDGADQFATKYATRHRDDAGDDDAPMRIRDPGPDRDWLGEDDVASF